MSGLPTKPMSIQEIDIRKDSGSESRKQDISSSKLDEIYGILSNARRRAVIECLVESEGQIPFTQVKKFVAEAECGVSWEDIDTAKRRSIYVSLYQNHITALEEAGVVETDGRATGLLELGPNAGDVLERLPGRRKPRLFASVLNFF